MIKLMLQMTNRKNFKFKNLLLVIKLSLMDCLIINNYSFKKIKKKNKILKIY